MLPSPQVTFQLILWFLPTFFWPGEPLPVQPTADAREDFFGIPPQDRIGNVITNFPETEFTAVYNRLLCPRCVTQNIAIATLLVSLYKK